MYRRNILALSALELSIFKPEHFAILFYSTLQITIETRIRFGLNLNGYSHLHTGTRRKLQDDLIDEIGKLFLGLNRIKFDVGVELFL